VSEGDITTFLQEVNATLGGVGIDRSEVVGVDIGVLPDASPAAFNATPRAHEKITNRDSYIEVLSTKYTTFRSQARAVLELL
jgi:hypothetical protein